MVGRTWQVGANATVFLLELAGGGASPREKSDDMVVLEPPRELEVPLSEVIFGVLR